MRRIAFGADDEANAPKQVIFKEENEMLRQLYRNFDPLRGLESLEQRSVGFVRADLKELCGVRPPPRSSCDGKLRALYQTKRAGDSAEYGRGKGPEGRNDQKRVRQFPLSFRIDFLPAVQARMDGMRRARNENRSNARISKEEQVLIRDPRICGTIQLKQINSSGRWAGTHIFSAPVERSLPPRNREAIRRLGNFRCRLWARSQRREKGGGCALACEGRSNKRDC